MIVYQASKRQFIHDTFHDDIEFVLSQQYLRTTGRQPAPAEFKAWQHSLFEVGEVLKDEAIPDDMDKTRRFSLPQAPVVQLKCYAIDAPAVLQLKRAPKQ